MKFSEHWLREWVNPPVNTQQLAEQLTMAGLEVDAIETVAPDFHGVVVGHVLKAEPHPNADKLKLCLVDAGQAEPLQVVCGAANARPGLKAPLALVDAELPGHVKIKKAKLRGVESCGMLCASLELGFAAEENTGLMELPLDAPVGVNIREYLQLDDHLITVDLTPNRGDCLSIVGIAREVAALNNINILPNNIQEVKETISDKLSIKILDKGCPHYLSRIIKGIYSEAQTPLWMREKLQRSGIRSIHPVVDVTHYVMLELGQPLHAFDLNKLQGDIQVRLARPGEKLTLLDGKDIELTADTLIIADAHHPLAIAGVIGGIATGVTAGTLDILLECAFFDPAVIAGKARYYGCLTESAHRFERGVDYQLKHRALERATQLLIEVVGGKAGPLMTEKHPGITLSSSVIQLRQERIQRLLGTTLTTTEIESILQRLAITCAPISGGWELRVPSYRFDLKIEADIIEELARVFGYQNIDITVPTTALMQRTTGSETQGLHAKIKQTLIARGYHEVMTYSFVDAAIQRLVDDQNKPIALMNPISTDMAVMRTTLLGSLLKTLSYNLNHQQVRVRLFEMGPCFFQESNSIRQETTLMGIICGLRYPESWNQGSENVDFYDIKSEVETLCALTGHSAALEFKPLQHCALQPGQSAEIIYKGQKIGHLGALHPALQRKLDLNTKVYLFELRLAAITEQKIPIVTGINYYPEVRRDIAIVIHQNLSAQAVIDCIHANSEVGLKQVVLFDVYQGPHIGVNKKSFALGLTFQHPSRTLKDEEINAAVDRVVDALTKQFDAMLRN